MIASHALVKILEKEGITHAFGIPGAGINGVYKFLGESSIKHFCHRHEEACVHAASGFYRASGKMAVALCTSGPGATNFVTGVYTSNIDCIPLVAITGQAVTAQLGKDAFQCVDIAEICKPVAKKTWCVKDAKTLPAVFAEAFHTAREGKKGVVVIDLPLDVQNADIDFDIASYKPIPVVSPAPAQGEVDKALALIAEAKNPILLMGGGVMQADMTSECVGLAELLKDAAEVVELLLRDVQDVRHVAGAHGTVFGAVEKGFQSVFVGVVLVQGFSRFAGDEAEEGEIYFSQGGRRDAEI